MSKVNLGWPKFTAHDPQGNSCGHQHQSEQAARNCADELAKKHPGQEFIVRQRLSDGSSKPTRYRVSTT